MKNFVGSSIILFLLCSCTSESALERVQHATLEINPKVKLISAINSYPYFKKNPTWEQYEVRKGIYNVALIGEIDLDKYEAVCGKDVAYKDRISKDSSIRIGVTFQTETPKGFRYFSSNSSAVLSDKKIADRVETAAEILYNLYGKQPVMYCSWLVGLD